MCITSNFAQQTVKGKVVDLESQFPLPGVNVQIADGDFSVGVATSVNGQFKVRKRAVRKTPNKIYFHWL